MKSAIFFFLFILVFMEGKCQTLNPGNGSFNFTGYGPLSSKPVKVYYHIPFGITDSTPILLVFHGEERDGQPYVNDWISASDQHKFMVFAPEFSDTDFPGGDGYNLANIFVDGDNPSQATLNPDSVWTFSIIDPLFLEIKQRTNNATSSYIAFGHSAGSQFLSRFLMFKPESQMQKAICANAGWYTVPDPAIQFPYGTGQSPANELLIRKAFEKKLIVMLGKEDNNPNSAGLRHNEQSDAQGLNRLARGRWFFNKSQQRATALNTPFNWSLVEVPGVGHDHTLMAINAIPYVIQPLGTNSQQSASGISVSYTNHTIQMSGLSANEVYEIMVFSLSGAAVATINGVFTGETVVWKPPVSGIYLLSLRTASAKSKTQKIFALK